MRVALLLLLLLSLFGCNHTCPVAEAARPTQPARFAVVATSNTTAQIILLATRASGDGGTAQTVEPIRDYVGATAGSTVMASAWLDQRSRWHDSLGRDMRGTGIGLTPVLPPALPGGAFVSVGGATSVVHFPLGEQAYGDDAGVLTVDAGAPPAEPSHLWEFVWPTSETPPPSGTAVPQLADLIVIPEDAPDPDIAIVSRTVVVSGGGITAGMFTGGETFILNVDDPAHVVSLATVSLDMYADAGLHAVATNFAYDDRVLYAAIDHEDFRQENPTYGPGLVAIINPAMRSVRGVLRIPNLTNCTQIAPFVRPSDSTEPASLRRMVVTCLGTPPATIGTPPPDAGFAYLEYDATQPDRLPSVERTITAMSLGLPRADGGSVPLYGHWIAYVSHGSASPPFSDRLIVANLDTTASQILASAPAANGVSIYGLGHGAFDPSSGVLVVPNGFDGVLTWWVPSDARTFEATSYVFPDSTSVGIVSCGHVAAQVARVIGGGSATVLPTPDAGLTIDDSGSVPDDAGVVPDDAAVIPEDTGETPDVG